PDHRKPGTSSKPGRNLDRTSLHHGPHVLHGRRIDGADGRPSHKIGLQPDVETMRLLPIVFAVAPLWAWPGGAIARENDGLQARIDSALSRPARSLIAKQQKEGAWRSETSGNMKDGSSLTPTVLNTISFLPQAGPAGKAAFQKGIDYLIAYVGPDGKIKA